MLLNSKLHQCDFQFHFFSGLFCLKWLMQSYGFVTQIVLQDLDVKEGGLHDILAILTMKRY